MKGRVVAILVMVLVPLVGMAILFRMLPKTKALVLGGTPPAST